MRSPPTKVCAKCGRVLSWRPRWSRDWDAVRYCSAKCRRRPIDDVDRALEREIVDLLGSRKGRTICPSEAARSVDPEDWRALMEPARQAARRLVARGEAEILQRGQRVNPSTAKGPIRIRLTR